MEANKVVVSSVDEYILGFPPETQKILQELRKVIKTSAPGAVEKISYQMPAFALNGILVWFAAHKNHVGFYPTSSGIAAFKRELEGYNTAKGTVQFPLGRPLPLKLISRIVKFRVAEDAKAKRGRYDPSSLKHRNRRAEVE